MAVSPMNLSDSVLLPFLWVRKVPMSLSLGPTAVPWSYISVVYLATQPASKPQGALGYHSEHAR